MRVISLSKFLTLVLPLVISLFIFKNVFAQSADQYAQIQKQIQETTAKIDSLKKTEKDLKTQIAYFDNQIKLSELQIQQATVKIEQLEKEINVLGFRINYISDSASRLEVLLKQRIVATYQQSFVSNIELLVTSADFSDLILRLQYVKQVQDNDKKLLTNLLQTKSTYANQKDDREDKQAQIEEEKKKLDTSRALLAKQKQEKNDFLKVTQNDENKYQAELKRLRQA